LLESGAGIKSPIPELCRNGKPRGLGESDTATNR
jgi:hypothetical protein